MTITVTPEQIARMRLHSLWLMPSKTKRTPLDVVRHHLAMQAQDFTASRWAVGSRIYDAIEADVFAAYDAGEIVRSWPMRGTVHTVAAEDLHWMLDLMGTRALAGVARLWDYLGINESMLEKAREATIERLRGGRCCTRAELRETLEAAGLDLGGQRAYHTVWYLAQTGTIVLGPTSGKDHQLVLLDEWIRSPRRLSRDTALRELGHRYFAARGPASIDDLQHWSKLIKADCKQAVEHNRDTLVDVTCNGRVMLVDRQCFEKYAQSGPRPALALAAFDEHLLGYRVRDEVLDPKYARMVDPGRNGVFRWTIVLDGRVVATWKRTPRTKHVRIEVTPFSAVPQRRQAGVSTALERWGKFAGKPVETTFIKP